jgi:hypothetical protein
MNEEMLDLKWKLENKLSFFWLFIPSTFSLSYLFAYLHKQVDANLVEAFNF